jgi:hypothetical protein
LRLTLLPSFLNSGISVRITLRRARLKKASQKGYL